MMKAGMKNRLGGSSFISEMERALPASPIYARPEQNPRAKLLYHRTAGGRNARSLLTTEASISAAMDMADMTEEIRVRIKPDEVSVMEEMKSCER